MAWEAMSSNVLPRISFSSLPGETQIPDPFASRHPDFCGSKLFTVMPGKGSRRATLVMVLFTIRFPEA
jgi:hypothetical protein